MSSCQTHKRKLTCRTSCTWPLPQWQPPFHHGAEALPAAVGVVVCAPETAGVDVGAAVAADVPVPMSMDEVLVLYTRVAAAIDCRERAEVDGLHPQKRRRCLTRTQPMPSLLLALRMQKSMRLLLRNVRRPPLPSATGPAPASSIEEAATAAAAHIASQPSGDSGLSDGADKEEAAGDTQDTHAGPAGTDNSGRHELGSSSRVTPQGVSYSRSTLPPHHRGAMSLGRASLFSKRRRFEDMAHRGGINLDARIVDCM